MKYNPSLKYNLKKITEDQLPPDSWFKEYMQDVRNGEGWVHLDKVLVDISDTLNLDLYGKAGEVARTIRRLGYGKYLRESAKKINEAYYIKHPNKNTYFCYMGGSPAWGPKSLAIPFDSEEDAKKFMIKYDYVLDIDGPKIVKESTKVLKEAKQESYNRLEFETIGGKPEIQFIGDEIHMSCWSSGAKVFKSPDFEKKLEAAGERGEYNKFLQDVYDDITKDLLKAMNRFDNDVKAILKKYGFK